MTDEKKPRVSIASIEEVLSDDDGPAVEILPNGEVRTVARAARDGEAPALLTRREGLGSHY